QQRELAVEAAAESTHAYSRATMWVWAAIGAVDRGDIAGFRQDVESLQPYLADDPPAQVRLAAEMFAGHIDVSAGRTAAGLSRARANGDRIVFADAAAPGLPAVAARLLLEDYALAGESRAGLALADEALGMGRGTQLWEAEIRRLRAGFLAALGASPGEVTAE